VTANKTECINTTTALFELNLTGHLANNTLYQFLNDIHINTQGVDIGIGVIKVCEQNCTAPTVINGPDDSDDNDEKIFLKLILIVLMVAVVLFLMLIITICLIMYYKRCVSTCSYTK